MIVVTAPTGSIGRQVAMLLLDGGTPVRVIARDPARLDPAIRDRAEVVTGSHGDPDVLDKAVPGAGALFWLAPPNPHAATVDEAYAEFTRPVLPALRSVRVVGVSALGRGTPQAPHAGLVTGSLRMDDLIAASGVTYRALALPSFMDNLLRQVVPIRDQGVFFSPVAGARRSPAGAPAAIAAAAVQLLLDDSWTGAGEQPVLGPEDLSFDEMAVIMSEVLGRPVRCERITAEAHRERLIANGWSEAMARGQADMMLAKDAGLDDGVARTPSTSSPTTFRQWCAEVLKPATERRTSAS